ncbi:MAG: sel1 repeat family protein [Devosia sp.]|nr:sel1 repeat family protein [Devosia sp.]
MVVRSSVESERIRWARAPYSAMVLTMWLCCAAVPALAQVSGVLPALPNAPATAADAALFMANRLDGAGGGISTMDQIAALEDAALAGQPMALYQLGLMYEAGEGVERDPVKAFGYFSQIADEHADTAPRGLEADIVAQSFLKVGEYYRTGLPEAGIPKNEDYSNKLILHAASYFGDADAQYRVGELYLDDAELGASPLQSARWLNLAARKGHAGAQAKLGSMLFNGEGIGIDQIEGLMWLTVASRRAVGTSDESWINDLLNNAMSIASADQRQQAVQRADSLGTRFGGL